MAAASNHSPRSSGSINDPSSVFNSPRSRRGTPVRDVVVPWPQLVSGSESELFFVAAADAHSSLAMGDARGPIDNYSPDWSPSKAATVSYSSLSSMSSPDHSAGEAPHADYSDNGGRSSNAARKQVWNKPSNSAVEIGPVMGAVSWPALSESTRALPKSASSDSFKPMSDLLVPASQGTGITPSTAPNLVISNNANLTVTPPTRQKSTKKVSGSSSGSITSNGSLPQLQPPWGPEVEMPSNNSKRSGLVVPDSYPRDHTSKESGQRGGFGSQSHGGSDNSQRISFRRGNGGGPYPRGDGSYYQNYRGRRDQDGGSHEWNSHRSFGGRDPHVHPQRVVPRGLIRPSPHNSTAFIPPPPPVPMQPPFGNHIIYPEMPASVIYVPAPPPDSFRGVPVMAQMTPHAMFFSMPDQLRLRIISQIDYYFSNENLIRDIYLRQNMDEHGWVPINLIAGFAKVKLLTDSIALILDALRFSNIVEPKDDKVRKRHDWWRWIMPPPAQFPNISNPPQSLGRRRSSQDMLAANIQTMSLKQCQDDGFPSRSSSGGDFSSSSSRSSQSQSSSGGERTGQPAFQSGESSISTSK